MKYLRFTFFIVPLLYISCGKGLAPEPEPEITQTGFGGKITFVGNWPPDVTRTHIVAFKRPLNSAGDFNPFNLGFVGDSIPPGISVFDYMSFEKPLVNILPGEYSYLAVAQSKTPQLSLNRADWYVIGIYYSEGDTTKPGKLIIPQNSFVPNINIRCDFTNPPPQPPGG